MNSTIWTSDHATHAKIVATALLAIAVVFLVGVCAKPGAVAGPAIVAAAAQD